MTADAARGFLARHVPGRPLLLPNPWDVGSARLLVSLGFEALATTSSGHAATLGRLDGGVTREEAIAHAAALAAAVAPDGIPVSADLEHGFFDEPEDVAETAALAVAAGLAGFSIEDSTGAPDVPIYEASLAAERVAAAVDAAGDRSVVTARCELYLRGQRDLGAVIDRLQSYGAAGAQVLFAPGVVDLDEVRTLVSAVDKPVNVLAMPGAPSVAELAEAGVARVSVGGAFAFAAYGALIEAATELRDAGTYGYRDRSSIGAKAVRDAFGR